MSVITSVGKRYTIVIPKEIREKVKISEGSKVLISVRSGKIIIEPLPEDPFKVLGEVIGEPYKEEVDERKAMEWLMKNASSRY